MARARDLQTLIDSVKPTAGEMLTVPDLVARRALSVVASYARDAGDCRLLLQALGLMPEGRTGCAFPRRRASAGQLRRRKVSGGRPVNAAVYERRHRAGPCYQKRDSSPGQHPRRPEPSKKRRLSDT
ncbi:hypothetical protein [Kitasatospora herbaricolor]|uniref:hypothetical protein n=1 Tax=Kitasatospora herbaricolor TaxID=68217 RepID=UPI0036D81380